MPIEVPTYVFVVRFHQEKDTLEIRLMALRRIFELHAVLEQDNRDN